MKYSQVSETKSKIMQALEKAVDEMFDQLQANEFAQAVDNKNVYPNLEPGYLDAMLVMDFPKYCGSNSKGFHIICNPVVMLKKDTYYDKNLAKARSSLQEKLLKKTSKTA
jgi:hypothetical protein